MALNFEKLKERLTKAQGKGTGSKFFKPEEGDQTIRIVPTPDGDPFKDFWFHYNVGKNPGFLCPQKNYGEDCPICEFATKLWKEETEDGKQMAKRLFVRRRFFAPVLVRGKEKEGILIWSYGKTVYETLIKLCLNPEYGDITDPEQGTDLDMSYGTPAGASYPKTVLQPKRSVSKLCKGMTKKECEELLKTLPDIEALMERKTTAECEALLNSWLSSDDSEGADSSLGQEKYADTPEEKSEVDKEFDDLLGQ